MKIDYKERVKRDIAKLEKLLAKFKEEGLDRKHPDICSWAENYKNDAIHFFNKEDYFSAFGCANYAYGMLESIFMFESKKKECECYD